MTGPEREGGEELKVTEEEEAWALREKMLVTSSKTKELFTGMKYDFNQYHPGDRTPEALAYLDSIEEVLKSCLLEEKTALSLTSCSDVEFINNVFFPKCEEAGTRLEYYLKEVDRTLAEFLSKRKRKR